MLREVVLTPLWIGTMDKEDQSAEELFGAALDLAPDERSAFLDQACQNAPELRQLVEELLLENDRAGSFMAAPLFAPQGISSGSAISSQLPPGTMVSRYSIVSPLGSGGMGVIYQARDIELARL